jgi:hypothetical protein
MATFQRGNLVYFLHARRRDGVRPHRVQSIAHDGAVELDDMLGRFFSPHLFMLAADDDSIAPSAGEAANPILDATRGSYSRLAADIMDKAFAALPTAEQDCAVASILLALQPFTDAEALSIATCVLTSIIDHVSSRATHSTRDPYVTLASAIGTTLSNPSASARCRRLKFRNRET